MRAIVGKEYDPSPYDFEDIWGPEINPKAVMLGVGPLKKGILDSVEILGTERRDRVEGENVYFEILPEEEHIGGSPWEQGKVDTKDLHLTLKYGILSGDDDTLEKNISAVLEGWTPDKRVYVSNFGVFENEKYDVVVAKIFDPNMDEANKRLSCLPHMDFHHEYRQHVTLGYVHPGFGNSVVRRFANHNFDLWSRDVSFFYFETKEVFWS